MRTGFRSSCSCSSCLINAPGVELERGLRVEDAKDHLDNCNNEKEIATCKRKMAGLKISDEKKEKQAEQQEDVQAFKTWEHNG